MDLVCHVNRGKEIESQHIVYAVVINEDNEIIFSSGDLNYITCIRSSLKPFQASTLIKYSGHKKFNLTNREISLICASHSAEKIHTDTLKKILKKINCTINDLECGPHPAYDVETRDIMLKKDIPFSNIHNNCSGKHAGMLALARTLNINNTHYIKKNHIVQKTIFKHILQYAKTSPHNISIDGCSVPTPFYSLYTIAKMYLKLIDRKSLDLNIIYKVITENPYMIAGKNRFDTDFIDTMNGKGISKGGGEAIQGLAMETKEYGKISMGLKVLSGSHLVRDVAIMSILKHLDVLTTVELGKLKNYIQKPILNHNGIQTGSVTGNIKG